ncbi:hypothetical protein [Pseudonocardia sp.]|uniref:hypothetical protein n=1 Tax=Pseudonocardia sp. TaxID=60912 RepID=UPI003D0F4D8C
MPAHRARHRASTPAVDAAGSLLDGPTDQWVPVQRDRALRRLTYVSCGLAAGTVLVTAGITAAIADLPAPATTVAVDPAAAAAQLGTPAPAAPAERATTATPPPRTEARPVPALTPPPAAPEAVPSRKAGEPTATATRAKPTAAEDASDDSDSADTRSSGS